MKPRAILTSDQQWIQGVHAKCIHLHFDINGDRHAIAQYLADYLERYSDILEWDQFFLPNVDELADLYAETDFTPSKEALRILCDPRRYGAPQAHLSAKHFHGDISLKSDGDGYDFQKLMEIYREGCELLKISPFSGYVEVEDALEEVILPERRARPIGVDIPPIVRRPLQKTSLANIQEKLSRSPIPHLFRENGRRWFRTTEIHLSFEDISKVNPLVLTRLLDHGFYSAYKKSRFSEKIKFIATIQGFEHEISQIRTNTISYMLKPEINLSTSCEVKIKKEDILSFMVFGDTPSLQDVVMPGQLLHDHHNSNSMQFACGQLI